MIMIVMSVCNLCLLYFFSTEDPRHSIPSRWHQIIRYSATNILDYGRLLSPSRLVLTSPKHTEGRRGGGVYAYDQELELIREFNMKLLLQ